MIIIRPATLNDVEGIIRVCTEGHRVTYEDLLPQEFVEQIIVMNYNYERVENEIQMIDESWNGWIVAVEDHEIIGAGGGGFNEAGEAEIFVLYLDPTRKRAGIGSKLLDEITKLHEAVGATTQWVSIAKGNDMGIPFYEAMGFEFVEEQASTDSESGIGKVHPVLRYKRELVK